MSAAAFERLKRAAWEVHSMLSQKGLAGVLQSLRSKAGGTVAMRIRAAQRQLFYDFALGSSRGRQASSVGLQYSKTLTTLRTPPVVRAISTASAASFSVTIPIR